MGVKRRRKRSHKSTHGEFKNTIDLGIYKNNKPRDNDDKYDITFSEVKKIITDYDKEMKQALINDIKGVLSKEAIYAMLHNVNLANSSSRVFMHYISEYEENKATNMFREVFEREHVNNSIKEQCELKELASLIDKDSIEPTCVGFKTEYDYYDGYVWAGFDITLNHKELFGHPLTCKTLTTYDKDNDVFRNELYLQFGGELCWRQSAMESRGFCELITDMPQSFIDKVDEMCFKVAEEYEDVIYNVRKYDETYGNYFKYYMNKYSRNRIILDSWSKVEPFVSNVSKTK